MNKRFSLDDQVETQLHRLSAVFPEFLTDLSVSVLKTPSNSLMVCFMVSLKAKTNDKPIASGHGWTAEAAVNNLMHRLNITRVQQYIQIKQFESFMDTKDQQVAA